MRVKSLMPRLAVLVVAAATLGADCDPETTRATLDKTVEQRDANRGRILFVSDRAEDNADIYTVNPDGSDPVRVTRTPQDEAWPCFVSLRSRIAFVRVDRIFTAWPDGTDEREIVGGGGQIDALACSIDGTRIAFSREVEGNFDLYVADVNGDGVTRITDDAAVDTAPTWAPTGQTLAFQSNRGGQRHIWLIEADGSQLRALTSGATQEENPNWGSHNRILFWRKDVAGQDAYVSVAPDGSDPQVIGVGMIGGVAAWSPDGQRFLFSSTFEGLPELFMWSGGSVQRFFTGGRPAGNRHPSWTPDPGRAPDPVR